MASKIQRWVDLLAALLRRSYPVSFEELIRDIPGYQDPGQTAETRRRMFERDKDELRRFGVPISTRQNGENEQGYQLRRADFYLPYLELLQHGRTTPLEPRQDRWGYQSLPTLAFEPDELRAIEDVAHRLPMLGVPSVLEDGRSALRKLGAGLPPTEIEAASATAHAATFDLLNDALERRKQVTFGYRSLSADTSRPRTVESYGLFFLGHHWYLAAVESGADQPVVKNFRLSRMTDVAVNRTKPGTADYAIPADFQLREHAQSRQAWELGSADAIVAEVIIALDNGASKAVARLGEEVEGSPDRRRFRVRRLDPFARWVLGFAGAVVPVSPEELVTRHREMVQQTLALYRGVGS